MRGIRVIRVVGGRIGRNFVNSPPIFLGSLVMVRDLKDNNICVNSVRSVRNSRNSRGMWANRANFASFAGILRHSLPLVRHLKRNI